MYIYSPSNGTNLGVMENAQEVVVKITSDLGGFSGSFSIDDELKETFEVPGKAEGNVNLEVEEVELSPFEDTVSVDFSDETGTVEAASTDSSVATASVDGDQINITIQDNPQEDIDTSEDNLTSYDCHINLSLWWEDLFNGEHTITININADVTHGIPGDVATFTFTKTTEGTVIQRKWKKIGYKLNPVMDEIEAQQVILCDRQLHRICELEPVENLRYVLNELNKANEISFNYYKYVNNKHTNGFENEPEKYITCPGFDRLQDLSIVQVGNEYFEVAVTKSDDGSMKKSVSGISLGFAELSQLISTIAINTDEDLDEDFKPTIFYDETNQEHSLLHRILNDAAPHYQVGHVDDTLSKIQRTFSWENTDVISMLNEIGEEINCVFDIVVNRDTDGNATRTVNAYDLCYCKTCWDEVREQGQKAEGSADLYRNIVNGRCQHCEELGRNPYNLHDIGYITNVFLSTEHMANSITVNGNKDQIKNSFKIEGGDDLMTDTVNGLSMTASNNLTIFSPQTKKEMTIGLHNALDQYEAEYKELQPYYEKLLQTEYNIQDIILYLQSGKMPVSDEVITNTKDALYSMISKFSSNEPGVGFDSIVYIDKKGDGKGNGAEFTANIAKSTLRKMLTLYLPKGFSLEVETESATDYFVGTIAIKKNVDNEDYYKLTIGNGPNILTKGKEYPEPDSYDDARQQLVITQFKPRYLFAETYSPTKKGWSSDNEAFLNYIQQYCQMLISKNLPVYENERERNWSEYGIVRLKGFLDGYVECRNKMYELSTTSETDFGKQTCAEIYCKYAYYINDIQKQIDITTDQYVALCRLNGSVEEKYKNYTWKSERWKSLSRDNYIPIIQSLLNNSRGGYLGSDIEKTEQVKKTNGTITVKFKIKNYTSSTYIGEKPYKCKKCGSTNVATESGENVCLRAGCNGRGSDIYTYKDIVEEIVDFSTNDISSYPFINYYGDKSEISLKIIQSNIQTNFDLDPRKITSTGSRSSTEIRDNSRLTLNQYNEMISFIREDVYSNSNYSSEGLSNAELIQKAMELRNKATRELAKACIPQYTLQVQLSSILALEPIEWQGKTMNADFKNFCINNYVHVQIDEDIYRLRIASIELVYPMNDTVTVTFTDASRYLGGGMSDIASIIAQAESIATSYNYYASQAERGVVADDEFKRIYDSGIDTALMNVLSARNQDIVMDQHGILLREMNEYTEQYDDHQLKLINRNIVFTKDNWQTASLAIGLGRFPYQRTDVDGHIVRDEDGNPVLEDKLVYGVWADVLVGEMLVGRNLLITNIDEDGKHSVTIDAKGIDIQGGFLNIGDNNNRVVIDPLKNRNNPNNNYIMYVKSNGIEAFTLDRTGTAYFRGGLIAGFLDLNDGKGNRVYIDPSKDKIMQATMNGTGEVFYIKKNGDAYLKGGITATWGKIANWNINTDKIWTGNENFKGSNGAYFGTSGLSITEKFWVDKNGNFQFGGSNGISFDGNTILMGSNTKIQWNSISDGESNVTTITEKTITTEYISAKTGKFTEVQANKMLSQATAVTDFVSMGATFFNNPAIDLMRLIFERNSPSAQADYHHGANAVTLMITKGKQASTNKDRSTSFFPPMIKLIPTKINGRFEDGVPIIEKKEYVDSTVAGLWITGRFVLGDDDMTGPEGNAFKCSIDGAIGASGFFHCGFNSKTDMYCFKKKKLSSLVKKDAIKDGYEDTLILYADPE